LEKNVYLDDAIYINNTMYKTILFIIVFLFCNCFVFSQDYIGCTWGDSIEKVKNIEGIENSQVINNQLIYKNKVLGKYVSYTLVYTFKENKLVAIEWNFLNFLYYDTLVSNLIDKYGKPTSFTYTMNQWKTKRTIITFSIKETMLTNVTPYTLKYEDIHQMVNDL